MSMFKRKTPLDLIENDIRETKKALISNQATAEHYQALANGNLTTLARLQAMHAEELKLQPTSVAVPAPKRAAKKEAAPKVDIEQLTDQTPTRGAREVKTKLRAA